MTSNYLRRSWCPFCIWGAAKNGPRVSQIVENEKNPKIAMGVRYMTEEDKKKNPALTILKKKTGHRFATMLPNKTSQGGLRVASGEEVDG